LRATAREGSLRNAFVTALITVLVLLEPMRNVPMFFR